MEEYIGSQQAFEDAINERYDEMERMNKEQEAEYTKQMYEEMAKEHFKEQEEEYYKFLKSQI